MNLSGYTVILSETLPAGTMVVSRDVFDVLSGKVPAPGSLDDLKLKVDALMQAMRGPAQVKVTVGEPLPPGETLFDADPNCDHRVIPTVGGGVRCTKCKGWFCY